MTFQDLVSRCMRDLGVLSPGEDPTPSEAEDARLIANDLIDAWGNEGLLIYYTLRTAKVLASGTASYTIGTGGAINIVRPVDLTDVRLVLDNTAATPIEVPLSLLSVAQYAAWPQKTQTGQPGAVYYDRNWVAGLGTIYVLPIPTVSTQSLALYTPVALAEFADLTTDYTFPPGYRRLLRYSVEAEIAGSYPSALVQAKLPNLLSMASMAKDAIKTANLQVPVLRLPTQMVTARRYDIYSGRPR